MEPARTALTCPDCGFDGARWSVDDMERTRAHADDLVGFVVEGWSSAERGTVHLGTDDDADADAVVATHSVMHLLDELAARRRDDERFDPMIGEVASLHASAGGVPKLPVDVAEIAAGGLVGDRQKNRRHHGRPWQAICLYSRDLLDELAVEGHPIVAGGVGENVTISGVDWARMRGGLTIEIGSVRLRTSSPATPCHQIGDCFTDRHWDRIHHDLRPGWSRWYASVLTGGTIRPGDGVTITA